MADYEVRGKKKTKKESGSSQTTDGTTTKEKDGSSQQTPFWKDEGKLLMTSGVAGGWALLRMFFLSGLWPLEAFIIALLFFYTSFFMKKGKNAIRFAGVLLLGFSLVPDISKLPQFVRIPSGTLLTDSSDQEVSSLPDSSEALSTSVIAASEFGGDGRYVLPTELKAGDMVTILPESSGGLYSLQYETLDVTGRTIQFNPLTGSYVSPEGQNTVKVANDFAPVIGVPWHQFLLCSDLTCFGAQSDSRGLTFTVPSNGSFSLSLNIQQGELPTVSSIPGQPATYTVEISR